MCMQTSVLQKPNCILLWYFWVSVWLLLKGPSVTCILIHREGLPLPYPTFPPASSPCTLVGCQEEGKAKGSLCLNLLPCSLSKPLCRTCWAGSVRSTSRSCEEEWPRPGSGRASPVPKKGHQKNLNRRKWACSCVWSTERKMACHVVSVHNIYYHFSQGLCVHPEQLHPRRSARLWMQPLGSAQAWRRSPEISSTWVLPGANELSLSALVFELKPLEHRWKPHQLPTVSSIFVDGFQ